jgi:hypothetical protein
VRAERRKQWKIHWRKYKHLYKGARTERRNKWRQKWEEKYTASEKALAKRQGFLLFRLQGIFLIFCASHDGLVPFRHFSYDTVA